MARRDLGKAWALAPAALLGERAAGREGATRDLLA